MITYEIDVPGEPLQSGKHLLPVVASMDVRIVYLKLLFCVFFISLTLFVYVTFFCFFNVLFTLSWLFVAICNYVCPMSVLLFLSSQTDCCYTVIYFPLGPARRFLHFDAG